MAVGYVRERVLRAQLWVAVPKRALQRHLSNFSKYFLNRILSSAVTSDEGVGPATGRWNIYIQ